jgi:hypothetical protein
MKLRDFVINRFTSLVKRSRLYTAQKSSLEYYWNPSKSYSPNNPTMIMLQGENQEMPKHPPRHEHWNLLYFTDSTTRHPRGACFFGESGEYHVFESIQDFLSELIAAGLVDGGNINFCGHGIGANAAIRLAELYHDSQCILVNPILFHALDSDSSDEMRTWISTLLGEDAEQISSKIGTFLFSNSDRTTVLHDDAWSVDSLFSDSAVRENDVIDIRRVNQFTESKLLEVVKNDGANFNDVIRRKYSPPTSVLKQHAEISIELTSRPVVVLEADFHFALDPYEDRSWRFWLQNFSWVQSHINNVPTHLQTQQAHFIVQKWFEHLDSGSVDREFFYHDHSLAYRGENLLKLLPFLDDEWTKVVKEHIMDIGQLLASPLEDNALSNHAFDQAVTLFLISHHFPDVSRSTYWMQLALKRLERELNYSFTHDGVHVENSPSYHHGMIANIYRSLNKVLSVTSNAAISEHLDSLSRAVPFLSWMIRPDGKVPPIGDSEEKMVSTQLATTLNPDGFPSTFSGMRVFGGGYGIWKSDQPKYHMTLKSCLHGRFHRHDDDCSITLWANGRNLIVDSGLLYYQERDKDRIHVRSAAAHSGFELPSKRASRNFFSSTAHRSKVFKVEPDRAKAVMGMYGNITASRTVHVQDQVATLTDQFSPSCLQHGIRVHFIVDGDWVPELKGQFIEFTDERGVQWTLNANGCSDNVEVVETFTSPLKNQKRNALRITFLPASEEVNFTIDFGGV